jgi:hypothetical protein
MIHHFARALAIRESARHGLGHTPRTAEQPAPMAVPNQPARPNPLRIRRDPQDTRRTVITGRFADVCAALDRLVELEAA